jgi:asparagine synthase (glutamine-hydrolysing)
MCGIIGIINPKGTPPETLAALSASLRHRGPDDEGFFLVDNHQISRQYGGVNTISFLDQMPNILQCEKGDARVALIHRRLSIVDLSPKGHQPMSTQDLQHTIVYNGEVYNHKEIRRELEGRGHIFRTESDTEVVLYAYLEYGAKCVEKFVGMWAFAIYDSAKKSIFISRDRFGIKPLYFYHKKDHFAFASEIKTLLLLDEVQPDVHAKDFIEFLSFGATTKPFDNLFSAVNDLAPGHNLTYDLQESRVTIERYYDVRAATRNTSITDARTQYAEAFEESIDLHLRADVQVGSCLSGGLDSSAIVAFAAPKMGGNTFHTYTAAFEEADVDESNYAKMVAGEFSNIEAHFTYPTADQLLRDIDKLIYHQDLPIGSTSIFAQWQVMKAAHKNNMKVLLDGQGADEVLGGYYNFAGIYVLEAAKRMKFGKAVGEYRALKRNFTPNMKNATARAAYYFLPEFMQRKVRAKQRLGMHMVGHEFQNVVQNIEVPKRGGKTYREHSFLSLEFGMYELLRYEDRNSMAFSIESRVPFLDHRLVELSLAMRNEDKLRKGWTKHILRKTIEDRLPKEIVWRKDKKGFVTPQQSWKNAVMPTLKEYIQSSDIPPILNKSYILDLCGQDLSNNSHLSEFWRVFSVLKWLEKYKVNIH